MKIETRYGKFEPPSQGDVGELAWPQKIACKMLLDSARVIGENAPRIYQEHSRHHLRPTDMAICLEPHVREATSIDQIVSLSWMVTSVYPLEVWFQPIGYGFSRLPGPGEASENAVVFWDRLEEKVVIEAEPRALKYIDGLLAVGA